MENMTIKVETVKEFIDIVYELVTKGLTFSSYKKDGNWIIELLGGY